MWAFVAKQISKAISSIKILMILITLFILLQLVVIDRFFDIPKQNDFTKKTDAIVVFTGGKERVKTAVSLFNQKLSPYLYISGVNDSSSKKEILHAVGFPGTDTENIFLDYAKNTEENAINVGQWVIENNIKSIRLVTTFYHMKRALILLKEQAPEIVILPHVIKRKGGGSAEFWGRLSEVVDELWHFKKEFLKFEFIYLKKIILT